MDNWEIIHVGYKVEGNSKLTCPALCRSQTRATMPPTIDENPRDYYSTIA
jgi:hypothetical protein